MLYVEFFTKEIGIFKKSKLLENRVISPISPRILNPVAQSFLKCPCEEVSDIFQMHNGKILLIEETMRIYH